MNGKQRIYIVNPARFRELKYKIKVSVDQMEPKSKALEKALNLELYDRAIQNPLVDQDSITRDFLLDVYRPGESDTCGTVMCCKISPTIRFPKSSTRNPIMCLKSPIATCAFFSIPRY